MAQSNIRHVPPLIQSLLDDDRDTEKIFDKITVSDLLHGRLARVKETKHREFKKLREKCDEDIRRETDKYQFEYDKLREEINMFQRRLGQEETLNKQLAVQNTNLGTNLSDLRG